MADRVGAHITGTFIRPRLISNSRQRWGLEDSAGESAGRRSHREPPDTSEVTMLFRALKRPWATIQQWVMLFVKLVYDFREKFENMDTLCFSSMGAPHPSQRGSLPVLPRAQAP